LKDRVSPEVKLRKLIVPVVSHFGIGAEIVQ